MHDLIFKGRLALANLRWWKGRCWFKIHFSTIGFNFKKNPLLSSSSLPAESMATKIRMNKFLMYVPKQRQKMVFRAVGMVFGLIMGPWRSFFGLIQAPVTAGQRRELPVAASSSGVRLMQSMTKTVPLLNTKFPYFFLALVRRALQMWRQGQKQPVFPLFLHASQPCSWSTGSSPWLLNWEKKMLLFQVTNESSLLVHSMHDCIVKSSLNHSLRKMLLIISPF